MCSYRTNLAGAETRQDETPPRADDGEVSFRLQESAGCVPAQSCPEGAIGVLMLLLSGEQHSVGHPTAQPQLVPSISRLEVRARSCFPDPLRQAA
jgi:hypothetical protein